eukprot:9485495-Pyramimonas_sp.AAC.1
MDMYKDELSPSSKKKAPNWLDGAPSEVLEEVRTQRTSLFAATGDRLAATGVGFAATGGGFAATGGGFAATGGGLASLDLERRRID